MKAKQSELVDLRERRLTPDEEHRDEQFLSKVQNLTQSLTDLSQQVDTEAYELLKHVLLIKIKAYIFAKSVFIIFNEGI